MNRYDFIPLVLMKSDKAGVLEPLQPSYCQGPQRTNRPSYPCLTSSRTSPDPAHGPGPHPAPALMQQQGRSPALHSPGHPKAVLTLGASVERGPDLPHHDKTSDNLGAWLTLMPSKCPHVCLHEQVPTSTISNGTELDD